MLQAIFFFIVLVWLKARFPDGGNRSDQDKMCFVFEEFVDKGDKNDKTL